MKNQNLFQDIPQLRIISAPTPVHALKGAQDWAHGANLFVKNEDATDPIYGGNKVRNLEFLLGDALQKDARKIITLAPLGSNFIAALAVQLKRLGMESEVFHFQPAESALIRSQTEFSASLGLKLNLYRGGRYLGAAKAQMALFFEAARNSHSYLIAPGGSETLGVFGHIKAVFELAEQIHSGEIPEPDVIVVGVGTCGTMAGLLAGIRLTGLKTKVIGVRCVDAIVCNPFRIMSLANSAFRRLNLRMRIRKNEIDLRDIDRMAYGVPMESADSLIEETRRSLGIDLDTTYTTKVISFLKSELALGEMSGRNILYWNTFSPGALLKPPQAQTVRRTFTSERLAEIS